VRYREDIPPEQWAVNASDDMLLFTMLLAIVIGCILIWLGVKGRQLWLVTWSIGLILVSLGFIGYEYIIET